MKMKTYSYSVSTNTIWTSFDYGEVQAENAEEAIKKAIEKLTYDFNKVNDVLNSADVTIGYSVHFNEKNVEVTELKY